MAAWEAQAVQQLALAVAAFAAPATRPEEDVELLLGAAASGGASLLGALPFRPAPAAVQAVVAAVQVLARRRRQWRAERTAFLGSLSAERTSRQVGPRALLACLLGRVARRRPTLESHQPFSLLGRAGAVGLPGRMLRERFANVSGLLGHVLFGLSSPPVACQGTAAVSRVGVPRVPAWQWRALRGSPSLKLDRSACDTAAATPPVLFCSLALPSMCQVAVGAELAQLLRVELPAHSVHAASRQPGRLSGIPNMLRWVGCAFGSPAACPGRQPGATAQLTDPP